MNFSDRLMAAIREKKTPLIVGLDPRADRLPPEFERSESRNGLADSFERFCCGVIDVVASMVPAVKPQAAFFESLGPAGMSALYNVVQHARKMGLLVIMDAKRGDIGSTAMAYAEAFLGDETNSAWASDGLTVNPYLGDDSLQPFVDRCIQVDAGIFVLVRTSNPGGKMLQELVADEQKIYRVVGDYVQEWAAKTIGESGYGSVGAVVGATHPQQLAELRLRMPNTIFLVPGLGAQGGTAADIAGAFDSEGLGAVVNSSRAIIFAHQSPEFAPFASDWRTAVEASTKSTIDAIASDTNAGLLLT